jgi:hypothetical protein
MDMNSIQRFLSTTMADLGVKILAAIAFWIVGRRLIGKVIGLMHAAKIPNVLAKPAPEVNLLDIDLVGCVVAVRPCCHTDHYRQVYFDTDEMRVRVARRTSWAALTRTPTRTPTPTPTPIMRTAPQ